MNFKVIIARAGTDLALAEEKAIELGAVGKEIFGTDMVFYIHGKFKESELSSLQMNLDIDITQFDEIELIGDLKNESNHEIYSILYKYEQYINK